MARSHTNLTPSTQATLGDPASKFVPDPTFYPLRKIGLKISLAPRTADCGKKDYPTNYTLYTPTPPPPNQPQKENETYFE